MLVIEATFLDRDSEIAREYGHLTAAKAAELAATSNVKQLVLTHISGRYPDVEILAEATRIFPNSRVAADFDHIVIWGHNLKMVKAHSGKLDVRSTMDGLEVSILLDVAA
jgi:hypothetical protein